MGRARVERHMPKKRPLLAQLIQPSAEDIMAMFDGDGDGRSPRRSSTKPSRHSPRNTTTSQPRRRLPKPTPSSTRPTPMEAVQSIWESLRPLSQLRSESNINYYKI